MLLNNLAELKGMIQAVLVKEGFTEFCQNCPVARCCIHMKPTCDYVIQKIDCAQDSGKLSANKPLECHFYICPILNDKNKKVSNWLMRVRESVTWPNTLEFPIDIEEFPK